MSNETFMPCRRIIASAAEPRGGRRVRGRAERTTFFTASNASAEAVVEEAVEEAAFPSDAEAEEAEAASSNGGDGDDDGGVRSRRHPCVLRRTQRQRMRLRQRPR